MRAALPAPVCTVTSRPRVLNFLTDSGVAATRVSSFAVSLRTASFMIWRSAVSPENRQEHHDQQDSDQRPFGESQESRIAAPMLADVHRTVLELGILRHELPLESAGTIANSRPWATAHFRAGLECSQSASRARRPATRARGWSSMMWCWACGISITGAARPSRL